MFSVLSIQYSKPDFMNVGLFKPGFYRKVLVNMLTGLAKPRNFLVV